MKINFVQVTTTEQIDTLTQLANTIWPEHYTPIIGQEQVDYMLETFHCADSISSEIKNKGYEYFLIIKDTTPIGYIGVNIEDKTLFLSKFYILLPYRKKGFGRVSIDFLKHLARSFDLTKITLTVNKKNEDTITAYQKMSFKITAELCADIGNGFVMDDYKMELNLI
ncbi:GNAT family N-acetyltransferase [Sulfurimonas marina]|uniref:GNAT family N-acetyltransferase n=1 Tax=Sulfurimonas marina TaxID=2590551 RepID=A0A7M1B131_9BACT|nr:GNAT family N-acetyltransferase [Sulfurimonas marina]